MFRVLTPYAGRTVFNGNMSLSSGSNPRAPSPTRSASAASESPSDIDESDSLVQVGSKSTIYISSSPRRRALTPPPPPPPPELRSVTPPVHTTVRSWRERTRAARSEVSSADDDARTASSQQRTSTTHSYTRGTDTLSAGRTLLALGSSTGTDVVASTLSLRDTADASLLGDSCRGSSAFEPYNAGRARDTARGRRSGTDEGYRAEVDVPAHATGASRASGQSLSYVSPPPVPVPIPGTPHPRAQQHLLAYASDADESEYATAASPSASFVSLDPVELLPGEDPDEVFGPAKEVKRPFVPPEIFWDGDQMRSVVGGGYDEDGDEEEEGEVREEETVHGEVEVEWSVALLMPPPTELMPAPEEPPTPVVQAAPSVISDPPADDEPKPESIPLPPSVYTPSALSEALPPQEPLTESAASSSSDTDSLSTLSLSGPPLSQLPAEPTPADLPPSTTAEVLSAVASILGGTPAPSVAPSESAPEPAPADEAAAGEEEAPLKSPSLATSWGAETDGTYDSSVLRASPSLRSEARSLMAVLPSGSEAASERDASVGGAEEEESEDGGAKTPVARAASVSGVAEGEAAESESEWSSSGPPSVPSNTLNTLSDEEKDQQHGLSVDAVSDGSMASSVLGPSMLDGEGEPGGSYVLERVEPKEYCEAAVCEHALPFSCY